MLHQSDEEQRLLKTSRRWDPNADTDQVKQSLHLQKQSQTEIACEETSKNTKGTTKRGNRH